MTTLKQREVPKVCAHCGSDRLVPIIYGMPAPDAFEAAERGEIALGGCILDEDSPAFRCADCGVGNGTLTRR